jgi:RHS repeat-associated protein
MLVIRKNRYKFSAKELDNETNYSYFGARYYDSDLSQWLYVDAMSDKYPDLSPYNTVHGIRWYC